MTDAELAHLRVERQRRRDAVGVIVGASELVGANGLHLTMREVDDMPEKVCQALHVLGVTEAEIAAVDGEGDPRDVHRANPAPAAVRAELGRRGRLGDENPDP